MDGNGRWAAGRGKPRIEGHRAGAEAVRTVVRAAAEARVEVLTLYAFSSENWSRPRAEVAALFSLLGKFLRRESCCHSPPGKMVTPPYEHHSNCG